MPTLLKKKGKTPGRPRTGRVRHGIRFTPEELARIDLLRRKVPRGVYLGRLALAQPLNPFDRFKLLAKK